MKKHMTCAALMGLLLWLVPLCGSPQALGVDYTGGTVTVTWETTPTGPLAVGETTGAAAAASAAYDPQFPDPAQERVRGGTLSFSFIWTAAANGLVLNPTSNGNLSSCTIGFTAASTTVNDKTVTAWCTVTGTAETIGPDGQWGTADDGAYSLIKGGSVDAHLTAVTVAVRMRRTGSGAAFYSGVYVETGGLDPDEHKADLELVASLPVADLPLTVSIKDGEGEGIDLAAQGGGYGTTDSQGEIATSGYISSDLVEDVTLEVVRTGETAVLTTGIVFQRWVGVVGWDVPGTFYPEEPAEWRVTLELEAGVPVTGHDIRFTTSEAVINWYEINLDTLEEDSDSSGYEAPFDGLPFGLDIADLIEQSGTTEEGGGTYMNTQTVHDYCDLVEVDGELLWCAAWVTEYLADIADFSIWVLEE